MNAPSKSHAALFSGFFALIVATVAFVRVSHSRADTERHQTDTGPAGMATTSGAIFAKPSTVQPTAETGAAEQRSIPWWAALSKAEIEARREDFEIMRDAPGAFPEFVEIHRQMLDAGVPRDVYEMECREVFGALLDLSQYERLETDIMLPVRLDPDHPNRYGRETAAKMYGEKRGAAEVEVRERLASVGFSSDSEAVARIFQLRPKTPLRRLATDPAPSSEPVYAPSPADVMAARFAEIRAQIDAAEHP